MDESSNYFYNFIVIFSGLSGQNLCIRILYSMDNNQYNELLEYLLNGQLLKKVDKKWASQFRK